MLDKRHIIAKNIALMLNDGDFVNLGVGMPTLIGSYIPEDITVFLHGENGCIGQDAIVGHCMHNNLDWENQNSGDNSTWKDGHKDLGNAGGEFITLIPGGSCFDSSIAFAMAHDCIPRLHGRIDVHTYVYQICILYSDDGNNEHY